MDRATENEAAPLLPEARTPQGDTAVDSSANTISAADFDPEGDEDNPLEWKPSFKWFIVFLLFLSAFTV